MNKILTISLIGMFASAVLAMSCDACELSADGEAAAVAPSNVSQAKKLSEFHPEDRQDVDEWSWPEEEQFKERLRRLRAIPKAPDVIAGTVRMNSVDDPDLERCFPIEQPHEFDDVILGFYEIGDEVQFFIAAGTPFEFKPDPVTGVDTLQRRIEDFVHKPYRRDSSYFETARNFLGSQQTTKTDREKRKSL